MYNDENEDLLSSYNNYKGIGVPGFHKVQGWL